MAEIGVDDYIVIEQKRKRRALKMTTTLVGVYSDKKEAKAVVKGLEDAYKAQRPKPHPYDFYLVSIGRLAKVHPPEES